MTLTALAIDDEPRALEVIQMHAAKVPFVALSATFTDAFEAIPYLQEHRIDLLFLDIKMPDISGIELLDCLQKVPMVIFSTAYSEFAVKGFELNAVDYLLKPYSLARFAQACNKALEVKQLRQTVIFSDTTSVAPFIFVKTGYEQEKVWLKDICYLEAEGNYVNYVLRDRQLLSRQSLAESLLSLPEQQFLRVHRSFVVAVAHVQKISRHGVWVGDREIPVGASFEERLEKLRTILKI
ncbi:LytR/AlgR family response regulator transcription factor [Persicitalea jodogahamensis]|uniref:DNA-binding response regulator n=1 Tax=Persicitalea jodogahamensis TaxID=402147 RepID=A0A8J3DA01_9BACT|nr:LytTR family DNA-binding domain-containing protein [Persicitalea jodogahamensis]GHB73815.1 DNA-binding response regulator [Persicitalea jodogahamensis]